VTSGAILYLSIKEAYSLGMLNYVWGNDASVSSPLLRLLLWLHYENRVLELLDTFVRISQKRLRAYGSLHVYLRIVSVRTLNTELCAALELLESVLCRNPKP
jgi:hypothetical protein